MAENTEVLRYQLDLADVEAKASRMQALLANIGKARAAGEDTKGLEEKLNKEVAGWEKLAQGQKKAGDEAIDFDRKAEKLVKGSLGMLSPQLAQAADFAIDLVEGFQKVNLTLLGVAGAGALIGVLVAVFGELARQANEARMAIERMDEALRKAREAGREERKSVAEVFADAGVGVTVQEAQRRAMAFQRPGLPEGFAATTAAAQTIAGLSDEDAQLFLRGLAATGGAEKLGTDQKKNAELIAKLVKLGREPAAAALLDLRTQANLPQGQAETLDQVMRQMREAGVFSDEQLRVVEQVARGREPLVPDGFRLSPEDERAVEAGRNVREQVDRAPREAPQPPVIINIGTQINPPSKRGVATDFGVAQRSTFGGH